jgi:hypothetical protein
MLSTSVSRLITISDPVVGAVSNSIVVALANENAVVSVPSIATLRSPWVRYWMVKGNRTCPAPEVNDSVVVAIAFSYSLKIA